MTIRSLPAAVLVAALAGLPRFAFAQTAAAPAVAPTQPSANTAEAGADAAAQARVEARIKQLHAQLKITQAEAPQWNSFAEVMRENARDMDAAAAQRAQQLPTMNAMQDLQSYEQLAEAHVQRLQKLIPAFEALYDAMSDQQKQIADQAFRGRAEARAQAAGAAQR